MPGAVKTSFFDLPAELRNLIYAYALIQDDPIVLPYAFKKAAFQEPALLSASLCIRAEAVALYYGSNVFEAPSPPSARQFLQQLRPENIAMIRAFRPIDLIVPLSAHRRWFDAMRMVINRLMLECGQAALRSEAIQVPIRRDCGKAHWCQLRDVDDFQVIHNDDGRWTVQWSESVTWHFGTG